MDLRQTGAVFRGVKVGVAKSRFKFHALAICAAFMTLAATGWGQRDISTPNTFVITSWDGWNGTAPTGFTQNRTYQSTTAGTTGGTYAIANSGFGWQATGSAPFTSVEVVGTFRNTTGSAQTSVTIEYDAFQIVNRASRTPGWTVTSSLGTVSALNWTFDSSKSAASPAVQTVTLTSLNIANNGTFTLTWASDRGGGSGSSPLIGLRNVKVRFNAAAPTLTAVTLGSALASSTYGTASAGTSFTAAGTALTGNITVTAQSGFEVSTASGSGYGSSVSVASGTTVWVRTAATRAAGAFNSTAVAVLSGGGAASSANVTSSASSNSVGKATLTITAANQTVSYGTEVATVTTAGSYTPTGFVNGDTSSVIGGTASYTTTYTATTAAGLNVATITPVTTSLTATNYSFTAANGNITVTAVVPSAPSITGVTAGNGQLSVAFTAPSSNGGAGVSNYEYSTNGGTNWTTPNPAVTSSPLLITGLSNGTTYDVQIRAVNSAGGGTATGTTQGTPFAPSSPTISVSPATFASALSTTYGTASSTASFTVSGATLSGNLTVTAPTGLEVSLAVGGSYSDSLELTPTSGTVSATTVYARLKATAAAGNYNGQSISATGGGASTQSVATTATGNTVAPKVITITGLGATGKDYDGTTSVTITGAATYDGLVNGEGHSVTDSVTWSFPDKSIGTGKVLTQSASYTAPNANYSLPVQPSLSADITAKELTGSFTANNKAFDNSTVATVASRAVGGAIDGDTVNHTGGTATFDNINVGTGKTVTLASATLTGADAGNYTLTSVSTTTANITQGAASITFAALPAGKKVGDEAFSAGATATLGATISYSSSNTAVATVNASTGLITLVAPGVTTITATVVGTTNYNAAAPASQMLNVAAAGGGSSAAFTGTYTFGSTDGNVDSFSYNGTPITNLTPSALTKVGVTTSSSSGNSRASNWGTGSVNSGAVGGSRDAGKYFEFTITAGGGFTVTDPTITFGVGRSGTGPRQFEWRSSLDNYATAIPVTANNASVTKTAGNVLQTPDANSGYTGNTVSLNTSGQSAITFRFYAYGAEDVAGTGGLQGNLAFSGTLVPQPAVPAITTNQSFSAMSTTYGVASAASATTVTVTGGSLTAGIVATAPTGFEVSNDGATYDRTATFAQTGGFANGTLYLRLAANAAAGSRSGNVVLSSTGATPVNVPVVASTVTAKALSVTADAMSKVYGESDPTLTYTSDGLVNGDALSGSLSRAVGTAVGTYAISQGTLANPNYSISFTGANFTITAASLASSAITLTPAGDGSYTASGPVGSTFDYSYAGRSANGITTSYSSATAPTAAGFYTVTATATGNYSGSNTADYFVAGPVAVADSRTKSAGNTTQLIPISELLANDRRISSTGTVETTGLTVTEVAIILEGPRAGAGSAARLVNYFVQFTPSSEPTDTFTYTVTDGTKTATATVTVTTETQAPEFRLQIVKVGTATFAGGNTTVTHDFIGVPNQTYLVEYATDLNGAWTSAGNQSTGATGSFSVTFEKDGNVAADWNAHMFFRARLLP